jgi:hypothetical protein
MALSQSSSRLACWRTLKLHKELWIEWDTIAKIDEDDPRMVSLSDRTTELAKRIVVTPVHTAEALDGKRRIVELEELESWDDLGLLEVILKLDAERVAAGLRGPGILRHARQCRGVRAQTGGLTFRSANGPPSGGLFFRPALSSGDF